MSFLTKLLGLDQDDTGTDPKAIEAISATLAEVEPDRARFLAAFAYLLARVAASDGQICGAESRQMHESLVAVGGCSEEEAVLVVRLAEIQAKEHGGTQDYLVTRLLKDMSNKSERAGVIAAMLRGAASDGAVEFSEEEEVRTVARQLGFSQQEFLQALSQHRDYRTVLKGML